MTRRPRAATAGTVLWLSVAALTAGVAVPRALAHAVLTRSTPPSRATLSAPPERVQLWFNERLEPAYSSASVWSAAGAQVDRGDARVSPEDPKSLFVSLPPVGPGVYTVQYRVLSVDGHVVEARFSFTVRARDTGR